jgi:hypothetical protein
MDFLKRIGSLGNFVMNLFNPKKSPKIMSVFDCQETNDQDKKLSDWMLSQDDDDKPSYPQPSSYPKKVIRVSFGGHSTADTAISNKNTASTPLVSVDIESLKRRIIGDSSFIYPRLSANSYRDIGSGGEKFIIPDNDGKKKCSRLIGIYPNKKTSSLALDKEAISRYKSMKVKDSGYPSEIPKSSLNEDLERRNIPVIKKLFLSSIDNQASEVITQNDEKKPDSFPRIVIFDIPHLVDGKFVTSGIISNPLESTYVNRSQIKTGVRPIRGFNSRLEGCRSNQVGTTSYIY